jgi:hypothetical protein
MNIAISIRDLIDAPRASKSALGHSFDSGQIASGAPRGLLDYRQIFPLHAQLSRYKKLEIRR